MAENSAELAMEVVGASVANKATAEGIVLTDPATLAGVNALEMVGLIAAGRAADVLAVA